MERENKKADKATKQSLPLFPFLPTIEVRAEVLVPQIRNPIWTENKAKLIERYLYYFVLVTKHGTYIDGFAGPQEPTHPETWAAKLVVESEPKWFRHFHFFDEDPKQMERLRDLRKRIGAADDAAGIGREIRVYEGDFNEQVLPVLKGDCIRQKEATFCLLDQRTFECHWATVKRLAEYKQAPNNKIELFYFLGVGWLKRAISGVKHESILQQWWGRSDWSKLSVMTEDEIRDEFVSRFRNELGYRYAHPWPIFERRAGQGRLMYYMVHATDHPAAPLLMARAYARAVTRRESVEQLKLELATVISP